MFKLSLYKPLAVDWTLIIFQRSPPNPSLMSAIYLIGSFSSHISAMVLNSPIYVLFDDHRKVLHFSETSHIMLPTVGWNYVTTIKTSPVSFAPLISFFFYKRIFLQRMSLHLKLYRWIFSMRPPTPNVFECCIGFLGTNTALHLPQLYALSANDGCFTFLTHWQCGWTVW